MSRSLYLSGTLLVFIIMAWVHSILGARFPFYALPVLCAILKYLCSVAMAFVWGQMLIIKSLIPPKSVLLYISMVLGIDVGIIHGLEIAVVTGVSASTGMDCMFYSFCLPFSLELGILIGIFWAGGSR